MKHRLLRVFILWTVCLILILACWQWNVNDSVQTVDITGEQLVAFNEIEQLTEHSISESASQADVQLLKDKCEAFKKNLHRSEQKTTSSVNYHSIWLIASVSILMMCGLFFYITHCIFRPFNGLKKYADRIAGGDFDFPLEIDRSNYFGELAWAFDAMRCEIKRARACEKEQVENNKTVIATLSHDIKTPIASVRAYAEALEAGLEESMEKRAQYTSVIMRKCDEVSKLTDDLFLHSISDLDKLQVHMETINLSALLKTTVEELNGTNHDLFLTIDNAPVFAAVDEKRMIQIIENLVNNARKYAKSKIEIHLNHTDSGIRLIIRDYGPGIPDEDMPFITQKFYRGRNCGTENGSGLGLYIVSYLMQQMNGKLQLHNLIDGLEITLILP